ncbi:MAG: hypothetical protein ABW250_02945 [Pyrinomonadaceae bacterium]
MTSAEWFVIQLLTAILAGFFALIAATLLYVETIADTTITTSAKHRIETVLQQIRSSPLTDLPTHILRFSIVLQLARDRIITWATNSNIGTKIVGTVAAISAVAAVIFKYGPIPILIFSLTWYLTTVFVKPRFPVFVRRAAQYLSDICAIMLAGSALLIFLEYSISLSALHKPQSLAIAVAISPVALVLADVLARFGKLDIDSTPSGLEPMAHSLYVAGVAVGLSVVATVTAVILGNLASLNTREVAISFQAIISNLACDTMTILLIVKLFALRDKTGKPRGLVTIVVISLATSAALACLSLYLSFVGTSNEIHPMKTLNVLIGLSLTGDGFELSVFFFLMHTTFIPAAVFLSALLSAAGVKLIVRVTTRILGLSSGDQVNPFRAFAAIFGIFVTALTAASGIAGIMKDNAKDREKPNTSIERTVTSNPVPIENRIRLRL